jgi:hypothetical protein
MQRSRVGQGDPVRAVAGSLHSIVLSDDNTLIYRKNILRARRRTVPSIRQKFALLNSKENFDDPRFARFRGLSASIGPFFGAHGKKADHRFDSGKTVNPAVGHARQRPDG